MICEFYLFWAFWFWFCGAWVCAWIAHRCLILCVEAVFGFVALLLLKKKLSRFTRFGLCVLFLHVVLYLFCGLYFCNHFAGVEFVIWLHTDGWSCACKACCYFYTVGAEDNCPRAARDISNKGVFVLFNFCSINKLPTLRAMLFVFVCYSFLVDVCICAWIARWGRIVCRKWCVSFVSRIAVGIVACALFAKVAVRGMLCRTSMFIKTYFCEAHFVNDDCFLCVCCVESCCCALRNFMNGRASRHVVNIICCGVCCY